MLGRVGRVRLGVEHQPLRLHQGVGAVLQCLGRHDVVEDAELLLFECGSAADPPLAALHVYTDFAPPGGPSSDPRCLRRREGFQPLVRDACTLLRVQRALLAHVGAERPVRAGRRAFENRTVHRRRLSTLGRTLGIVLGDRLFDYVQTGFGFETLNVRRFVPGASPVLPASLVDRRRGLGAGIESERTDSLALGLFTDDGHPEAQLRVVRRAGHFHVADMRRHGRARRRLVHRLFGVVHRCPASTLLQEEPLRSTLFARRGLHRGRVRVLDLIDQCTIALLHPSQDLVLLGPERVGAVLPGFPLLRLHLRGEASVIEGGQLGRLRVAAADNPATLQFRRDGFSVRVGRVGRPGGKLLDAGDDVAHDLDGVGVGRVANVVQHANGRREVTLGRRPRLDVVWVHAQEVSRASSQARIHRAPRDLSIDQVCFIDVDRLGVREVLSRLERACQERLGARSGG